MRLDEGPWSGRAVLYAARALRASDGQLFGAMQVAYSIDRVLSAITDPGIDKVRQWVVDQGEIGRAHV